MADSTPYLIINPNSNNKKTSKEIELILSTSKNVFGDFSYEITQQQGDGIPLAKKAIQEGYKTIVSIGGDGTLNEIMNVAVNTDAKIGMIAKGGACDAHKTHGIPRKLDRALEIIAQGYSEKFPVGWTKGDNERYFLEMADGAFTGAVAEASHHRLKWLYGDVRYIALAFQMAYQYKPIPSRITVDDQVIEGAISVFAVALSDVLGGFEIVPGNHPKKGDFAVIYAEDYKRMRLIAQLMRALNGNHIKAKKINIVRGKKVTIESESPMKWEAEGEIFSTEAKKLEFKYIPNAVNLIIPKEWKYELDKKEKSKLAKSILKNSV
ncbi:MAG: diacylglycerol/lipid kinase family protein [Candidatus Heimdallarchaeota archaeon]